MPLTRRVPKRGFHNPFRTTYIPVNLDGLGQFEAGQEVSPELLRKRVGRARVGEDIGRGELDRPLTVKAPRFLSQREGKIEAAGGRAEVLSHA